MIKIHFLIHFKVVLTLSWFVVLFGKSKREKK